VSITELVFRLTDKIHRDFYEGRSSEFYRDYRALVKAVTKYGHECEQRGWEIQPDGIYRDIYTLLCKMRGRREEIEYLPAYLEGAVRSHVNYRAEEIQARSMNTGRTVSIVMEGVKPVARVEPSTTELVAALHNSLLKRKSPKTKQKQLSLL
jgi:hypothetical protein